jgi:hypothetical protein
MKAPYFIGVCMSSKKHVSSGGTKVKTFTFLKISSIFPHVRRFSAERSEAKKSNLGDHIIKIGNVLVLQTAK